MPMAVAAGPLHPGGSTARRWFPRGVPHAVRRATGWPGPTALPPFSAPSLPRIGPGPIDSVPAVRPVGSTLTYIRPSPCGAGSIGRALREPGPIAPYRSTRGQQAVESRLARPPGRRRAGEASTEVRLTLKPGQRGTRRLLATYGDQLVPVRYRYDAARKKRFTTVEIVVDERDWTPRSRRPLDGEVVGVRVAFDEIDVRRRVGEAGGRGTRRGGSGS